MGDYQQTSYETPFSGGVPSSVTNALTDDFSNSRPQFEVDGAPVAGFAQLDPKWLLWDQGTQLDFGRVDTRTQMGELQASDKNIVAYFQQLPVPSTVGQVVELAIYGELRVGNAAPTSFPGQIGPAQLGLVIGDDFQGAPDSSTCRMLGFNFEHMSDDGSTPIATILEPSLADFVGFDAIPSATAGAENFTGCGFFRWRLRQTMVGVGNFTIDCAADFGSSGADWMPMYQYPQVTGAPAPLKSAGFGVYANTGSIVRMQIAQFLVALQPFDDAPGIMGGVQQLGAP